MTRNVWSVATTPFPGARCAVFPRKLIEPCILAGSRPGDVVLDAFARSNTTGQVATTLGMPV
jgi:site-specific DNA-methyltransferase (cytosine-N4-specific)